MYKFIRYKFYNEEITDWMFVPQTLQDVIDFNETYTKNICVNGFTNICKSVEETATWKYCNDDKKYFFGGHPSTYYELAFSTMMLAPSKESNIVGVANSLYEMTTKSRIDLFNKGCKFVIPSNGLTTVIYDEKHSEIIEEKYTDSIEFPTIYKPTYHDVRYIQWDNGKHWYAKIGKDDVVVDGIQKWDSRNEAEQAAMQFIKNNY